MPKRYTMIISVGSSLSAFKGLSLKKAMNLYLDLSEEFNLNAVEISFEKIKGIPSLWTWEVDDELKRFLKNFEVAGAHLPYVYLNPISQNVGIKKESIKQLWEAIKKARELGMNYVVMHARGLALDLSNKEEFEEWVKIFRKLVDYIEKSNILLTIENADSLWNLADVSRLIRRINSKWLKMTFDVGHAYVRKVPPLQKYPLKELSLRMLDMILPLSFINKNMPYKEYGSLRNFIQLEKDLIAVAHIHDFNGRRDHLPLGSGRINFSFILKVLKEWFKGPYIFEADVLNHNKDFIKNYYTFKRLIEG